jgi:hypothetical protein
VGYTLPPTSLALLAVYEFEAAQRSLRFGFPQAETPLLRCDGIFIALQKGTSAHSLRIVNAGISSY